MLSYHTSLHSLSPSLASSSAKAKEKRQRKMRGSEGEGELVKNLSPSLLWSIYAF